MLEARSDRSREPALFFSYPPILKLGLALRRDRLPYEYFRGTVARRKQKKWVREVKTASTSPPEGLFTKDAETIARTMASKRVSPKGLGSGIRMIQYFINRSGKDLPANRKRELEKAKKLLQEKQQKQKTSRKGKGHA